jgi:hypothetical protein
MNDSTIQMIAQAIIANTKVIQSLIDALPHETKQAVAEVVAPAPVVKAPEPVAAPVVKAPAPVITSVVESVLVTKPVVESAPVVTAPQMPAPPTFAPAAPAPVAAPSAAAPFTDGKGLIDYVMAAYRTMGPQKGAQIQNVLTGLGYQNINDIKQSDYAALYAGVEALKTS